MTPIKVLTITEPWASLVMIGAKQIETRSWATTYRGPLAIHASKGMTAADVDCALHDDAIADALAQGHAHGASAAIWTDYRERQAARNATAFGHTRGKIIATCRLVGCYHIGRDIDGNPQLLTSTGEAKRVPLSDVPLGDYTPGRFGWVIRDVCRLTVPVDARGSLGLWEFDLSGWWGDDQ